MSNDHKFKRPPLDLEAAFACLDLLAKDGLTVHEQRFKAEEIDEETLETIKSQYKEAHEKLKETIRAPKNRERPEYKGPPKLKIS